MDKLSKPCLMARSGYPVEKVTDVLPGLASMPLIGAAFVPPVPAEAVARAAVQVRGDGGLGLWVGLGYMHLSRAKTGLSCRLDASAFASQAVHRTSLCWLCAPCTAINLSHPTPPRHTFGYLADPGASCRRAVAGLWCQ